MVWCGVSKRALMYEEGVRGMIYPFSSVPEPISQLGRASSAGCEEWGGVGALRIPPDQRQFKSYGPAVRLYTLQTRVMTSRGGPAGKSHGAATW